MRGRPLRHAPRFISLHTLLEIKFFFGFQFSEKLIEVLLVLDGLFFRGFGFGQCHSCTNNKTGNCTDIGADLLRLDALTAFFGIFAVIFDQPTQCCKAMQTSTDRATELTAVPMMSFLILLSSRCVSSRISLRLSESSSEVLEKFCSLTLPSC